ncbi:MAG: ABC transporter permease [Gemmatimonadota bacterium]
MSFLLASAVKDLRRSRRDPLALAMWAGIPLIVGLLMRLAFGGDDAAPVARLLVADRDDTIVSSILVGAFGQGELADLVEVEPVEEDAGRRRLDRGDGSALLVIPPGFGAAILGRDRVTLLLLTNPAQRVLPGILQELLETLVEAATFAQRILREPLARVDAGPAAGAATFPDSTVASVSVAVNDLIERVEPYAFPPAIDLRVLEPNAGAAEERGFAELFFPGMLFLALLFLARALSGDVWRERSLGTLRRVATTPQRLSVFLGGKLLAGGLVGTGVALVGVAAGRWVFGIQLANLPLAVSWMGLSSAALLALFLLVQMHAGSERGGDLLTSFLVFPLAMAGGSFFPFEVMPDWLAAAGRLTPNGWALTQLTSIFRDEVDPGRLAAAVTGLSCAGAVALAVGVARLRRGLGRG